MAHPQNDVMAPQHQPWSTNLQDYLEDEPTLKMKIPPQFQEEDHQEKPQFRIHPNWGVIVAVLFCLAFWGSVYWAFTVFVNG